MAISYEVGRNSGLRQGRHRGAESVIEPLDVGEHAHGRMVLTRGPSVHAVCDARVYCMDMANTKLSLRRLWTIYKQILKDSTGNNRRDIVMAQGAFYAGARGVLRVLDYMLEHGEQESALRTIRRLGKARPLEQGGQIKGIQVKRSKRRLQ